MKDQLLAGIGRIPGVQWCCLVGTGGDPVLDPEKPPSCSPAVLTAAAERLGRVLLMSHQAGLHAHSMEMRYDDALVTGIRLSGKGLLLAFCRPDIDVTALIARARQLQDIPARDATQEHHNDDIEPLEIGDLEDASDGGAQPDPPLPPEMSLRLGQIRDALLLTIGPVAPMVFQDHLDAWKQQGLPTFQRLAQLEEAIASELQDPERIRLFRSCLTKG